MKMKAYEKKNLRIVRKGLSECMVLLKSDGSFPISGPGRIAAFGHGVRHTVKGGTGSGEVNSRFSVTVEQGLERAGFVLTTKEWLNAYDPVLIEAKIRFKLDIKRRAKEKGLSLFAAGMGAVMPEPEYNIPLKEDAWNRIQSRIQKLALESENEEEAYSAGYMLGGLTDTAIYVVSRISGEGNDRRIEKGDYLLNDSEIRDILICNRKYKHFMLVINAGGPVDLTPVMEVRNILVMSQLGVEMGDALADVLLGRAYPSGKLTTTWVGADQLSVLDFGNPDDTNYSEGIYVGYRYYDSFCSKILFPFGYGLGYTEFMASDVRIAWDASDQTRVQVSLRVTNIGDHPGKEVVQLYVSSPQGMLDQPYQSLAAFAKTGLLQKGESENLVLSFNMQELASYDEVISSFVLEQGEYILRVGADSRNTTIAGKVTLSENVIIRKARNILEGSEFKGRDNRFTELACDRTQGLFAEGREFASEDELENVENRGAIAASKSVENRSAIAASKNGGKKLSPPASLQFAPKSGRIPSLALSSDKIVTEYVDYDKKEAALKITNRMSDEMLAYMNIGAHSTLGGFTSVIGAAGKRVAGAAGESADFLKDHGIPPIVMADGPAGLRLSKFCYKYKEYYRSLGSAIPDSMMEVLPAYIQGAIKIAKPRPGKHVEIIRQYATAIPIGTAIAQSFNTEYMEALGDIVGSEMKRFDVQLWLAPALNIHRSALCGRNFEYYSEDPLVSGIVAAAITKGVQKHEGCGVTIKHYVANNQETNRYGSSSNVSERALREIYLRGFEICIRQSKPVSVMTSYNLVNGVHTSESRTLGEDVLRSEMGFDGIVMTDWLAAGTMQNGKGKYPEPDAGKIAYTGCSLVMPGSRKDYRSVLAAVRSGELSRRQLEINASRLIRMSRRLSGLE